MKKILAAAAALAVLTAASAASAQSVYGTNLTVNLSADVALRCDARLNSATGTILDIDFGTLSSVDTAATVSMGAGSMSYICNDADGFTRTISSANSGYLTLDGASTTANNRRIAYTMSHGGGSGLAFADTQLTAPLATNLGAMLGAQTGSVTFKANGVMTGGGTSAQSTSVFAGDYSDVVTIAIAAR